MDSSFPDRPFSYLNYVTYIIDEPQYKYGQQELVTIKNQNRSTALELSVLKCCVGGGAKAGFTGAQPRPQLLLYDKNNE